MGGFLVGAVLLVVLAVVFATAGLWRDARRLALGLAIALPLAAAGLYWLKGTPAALDPAQVVAPDAVPSMDEAIASLEKRVAAEPDNVDAAVLLARSYMALEEFDRAPAAFAHAVALAPDDVDLSVDYAEAQLRAAADHRFPPDAVARLEQAVVAQPTHQRALFFLGLHRLQQDRPGEAAALWERLLPLLEPEAAAALRPQVDTARAKAGLPPLPAASVPAPAQAQGGIDVTVQVAPGMAQGLPADAVLFVFARAPGGGGPPLAAKRIAGPAWPLQLHLSDADSPMPAGKLSSVPTVELRARLSRRGDVAAATGDLESAPVTAPTDGAAPVTLVLDRVVP